MNEYRNCILFLLAKAYQHISADFKERLNHFGLTPVQNLILAALREEDGVPVGEIGRKLLLDTATLTGTVDRMAHAGWVEKRHDDQDRRVVRVHLAAKAEELGPELSRLIREVNQRSLEKFSLEETLLLKRLLHDIRE